MNNQAITSNISYSNINNNKINGKLRVAVMENSYPFSYCKEKKIPPQNLEDETERYKTEFGGIAVKIWEEVAKKYNLDYEYICLNISYEDAIKEVKNNNYDVALGEFTITTERMKNVLFSRAYYFGKLKIFRKNKNDFVYNLLTNKFLISLLIFFIFIILFFTYIYKYYKYTTTIQSFFYIYGHFFQNDLFLFYEGRTNNMIRFINFIWSFVRFFFFAIIITQMINIIIQTSDTGISKSEYNNIKDVLVEAKTSHVQLVKSLGKNPVQIETTDDILKRIKDSNGDVYWFYEYKSAENLANKFDLELDATHDILYNDETCIIVNNKYPDIIEKFNNTLLELRDTGDIIDLCKIYLKDTYQSCLA